MEAAVHAHARWGDIRGSPCTHQVGDGDQAGVVGRQVERQGAAHDGVEDACSGSAGDDGIHHGKVHCHGELSLGGLSGRLGLGLAVGQHLLGGLSQDLGVLADQVLGVKPAHLAHKQGDGVDHQVVGLGR
jgi:hypothetical protein